MICFFAAFYQKYYKLQADTSSAHSFTLLKNFFTYVDDLEYHLFSRSVTKAEFKDAVEKITNLNISQKESDYLFSMVDANNDGVIDVENELYLNVGKMENARRKWDFSSSSQQHESTAINTKNILS